MKTQNEHLPPLCETLTIIDESKGTIQRYVELNVKPETPGLYQPANLKNPTSYLLSWGHGLVARIVSSLTPDQFQPSIIASAYKQAVQIKPVK